MDRLPIGIQLYNLRDILEGNPECFANVMAELKKMGYEGVEFAGLYGIAPEKIRDILSEVGLEAVSAHVPFDEMEADMDKVIRDYKTIGVKYIAVPYLPEELRPGTTKYAYVLESIRRFAEKSAENGIPMLYHNHDFEFVRMENGEYALDELYAGFPAALLKAEPDTCWIKVAGEDPVAYIRKYAGRCPLVHLKDFYKEGEASNMYQLLGAKDKEAETSGKFEFRPLGDGVQDLKEIIAAASDSSAQWLIYEQDEHYDVSGLGAAAKSREYLRKIYG